MSDPTAPDTAITLRAVVRYDGTGFAGWQVQPQVRTVQGELQSALSLLARRPVKVYGAGRTDAGVHAMGQVISFAWAPQVDLDWLRSRLCKMLGPEVLVDRVEVAPPDFHARWSACGKRYAYVLHLASFPDPFLDRYAWTLRYAIDVERLASLARMFEGTHDFAGFQCNGASPGPTERTIHRIRLRPGVMVGPELPGAWTLEFHGSGFLYKMVRNITGTLVDVARGHYPEQRITEYLIAPGPYRGYTAPGKGLFLVEVEYPN